MLLLEFRLLDLAELRELGDLVVDVVHGSLLFLGLLLAIVVVLVLGNCPLHVLVLGFEIAEFGVLNVLFDREDVSRMQLRVEPRLQLPLLLEREFLLLLEGCAELFVLSLQILNLPVLLHVRLLLFLELLVDHIRILGQHVLLVVELILEREEVLIERNAVPQQCFIAGGFILLVNFSLLELFDLMFEDVDLLLEIEPILVLEVSHFIIRCSFLRPLRLLVEITLQIGVALELLVRNASICVCKHHICLFARVAGYFTHLEFSFRFYLYLRF